MPDEFNPAPDDKHAEEPAKAVAEDEKKTRLDDALKDSFPASDPPSSTQPKMPEGGKE